MAEKFNTGTEGFRTDLTTVAPIQGQNGTEQTAPADAAHRLGAAVGSIFNTVLQGPDPEVALGQYAAEAGAIVGQTAGYKEERERLLQGLASTTDKAAVEQFYKELSRLRRGEIQGKLSPAKASLYISNLTKDAILRNPQLATKFRTMSSGLQEDVNRVAGMKGDEVDPDMAALSNLIKEATSKGFTVQEEIQFQNTAAQDQIQQREAQAKLRLGVATQATLSSSVMSSMNVFYGDQSPRFFNALKNPQLTGPQIGNDLREHKRMVIQQINTTLADAQVKGNMVFEKGYQEQLIQQATAPLDVWIQIADRTDNIELRTKLSDNMRKQSENAAAATLADAYGPFSIIARGTDDLIKYGDFFAKTVEQVRAGQIKTLEAISKYDPKMKVTLDFIRGKGLDKFLAQAAKDVDDGKLPEDTGDPVLNKLGLQGGLNYALNPEMPNEEKGKKLAILAGHPDAFEAWDKRKDVAELTKQFPQAIDSLRRSSPKLLMDPAAKASQEEVNSIKFNALSRVAPFSLETTMFGNNPLNLGPGMNIQGGLYGENLRYSSTDSIRLRDKLNQQYRVFSNYMSVPELMKWGATTLDDLKASKTPGYAPVPTVPAATVAPQEPIGETGAVSMPKQEDEVVGMLPMATKSPGMLVQGNIDLDDRIPTDNGDGTFSTLQSITIEEDGKYILIPTLNSRGKKLSDEDAVTLYHYTNEQLGVFETQAAADEFAKRLSSYMERAK